MIHAHTKISKDILATANRILGYDLEKLCSDGPLEKLNQTLYSQPAMFVGAWIAFQELKAAKPDYFKAEDYDLVLAGLSLGEYTALTAAGIFSFENALRCVQERANAMQDTAEMRVGGMTTVVGLTRVELEEVCAHVKAKILEVGQNLAVANYLFPGCAVVSGDNDALEAIELPAKRAGARIVRRLPVAGAFHTEAMEPAIQRLDAALFQCNFKYPESHVRVFANTTGDHYHDFSADSVRKSLTEQLVSPVQWENTLKTLVTEFTDGDVFIELGPGRQLSAMLKRFSPPQPLLDSLLYVTSGTFQSDLHLQEEMEDNQTSLGGPDKQDYSLNLPSAEKPWQLYKIRIPIPNVSKNTNGVASANTAPVVA